MFAKTPFPERSDRRTDGTCGQHQHLPQVRHESSAAQQAHGHPGWELPAPMEVPKSNPITEGNTSWGHDRPLTWHLLLQEREAPAIPSCSPKPSEEGEAGHPRASPPGCLLRGPHPASLSGKRSQARHSGLSELHSHKG